VPSITTHVGFIPENPADPLYAGTVEALKEIAAYCAERGPQQIEDIGRAKRLLERLLQST